MSTELKPCPFCGAGKTDIHPNGRIWSGMKFSEPTSVSIRHWCEDVPGQPHRMIERVGRDEASAVEAWNRRALSAQPPADPDMRHPKIQALIGSRARREIELRIAESLLDDTAHEISGMDGDYWLPMHDKIVALQQKSQPPAPSDHIPDAGKMVPGWQWVPVEPTEAMLKAGVIALNGNAVYKNVATEALRIEEQMYAEVYEAMLAAAPPPVRERLTTREADMLQALHSLLRHAERVSAVLAQECGVRFVDTGPLDMARAAIERATGEAQ